MLYFDANVKVLYIDSIATISQCQLCDSIIEKSEVIDVSDCILSIIWDDILYE